MISIRYDMTLVYAKSGGQGVSARRGITSAEPEKALADDIQLVLHRWAPQEEGEELRLYLGGAWHVHLGVHTFPCQDRLLRRAADRIWPVDPGTQLRASDAPVQNRLAHHLLKHGKAFARISPFTGLTASRN